MTVVRMRRWLVPEQLLISVATLAELTELDERTIRRHLPPNGAIGTGRIPLRRLEVGGSVRVSYEEAFAWVQAGCPTADDGWAWPPEQEVEPEDQLPAGDTPAASSG